MIKYVVILTIIGLVLDGDQHWNYDAKVRRYKTKDNQDSIIRILMDRRTGEDCVLGPVRVLSTWTHPP